MKTVLVDSQLLKAIQKCPIYTHMRFDMNLTLPKKSEALEKGNLVHHFMAGYYGHRLLTNNKADWRDCANIAFDATKPFTPTLELEQEDINNVLRCLEQYVELYKFEPIEVLVVENPFTFLLHESEEEDLRIIYSGVTDLIIRDHNHNIKVFDHKSQSRKSDFVILDDQFEGYALASQTNILYVNVVGLQSSVKPEEKMRRVPLSYTGDLLERWKAHAIYWIKQYMVYTIDEVFPENHQGCNAWGRNCDFLEVCQSISPEARAWKLQSSYVIGEKWDPTLPLQNRE